MQQTPGCSGVWGSFTFTEKFDQKVDYSVVLNNLETGVSTHCPPDKVYRIVQEPPTEFLKEWHINPSYSSKTFTCDPEYSGDEYIRSHPMVPWHINRDYDFLASTPVPDKTSKLSWITSTKNFLEGHKTRMGFLGDVANRIPELELIGTNIHHISNPEARKQNSEEQQRLGFKIVEDKWAGLAPYKYSLAIENFSGPDYWTEKLADCFLSWTLPIYYGCTNLEDYFPADSFVRIDINNPEEATRVIKQTIQANSWEKRINAISEARNLVLNEYQLFPAMSKFLKSL
jgi:hypothetical protein